MATDDMAQPAEQIVSPPEFPNALPPQAELHCLYNGYWLVEGGGVGLEEQLLEADATKYCDDAYPDVPQREPLAARRLDQPLLLLITWNTSPG
jgi:hypothetical protein